MEDKLRKLCVTCFCKALPLYITGAIFRAIIQLFGWSRILNMIVNVTLYGALFLTFVSVVCLFCIVFTDDND